MVSSRPSSPLWLWPVGGWHPDWHVSTSAPARPHSTAGALVKAYSQEFARRAGRGPGVLPTASPGTAVGPRRRRASANFGPHGQFPAAATPDLALYRRHGFTVLAAGVVAQRLARLDHTTGRSPGRSRGWINRLPQLANFARAPTDGMDDVRRVVTERVPRRQPAGSIVGSRRRLHLPRRAPSVAGRCQSSDRPAGVAFRPLERRRSTVGRPHGMANGRGAGGTVDSREQTVMPVALRRASKRSMPEIMEVDGGRRGRGRWRRARRSLCRCEAHRSRARRRAPG